MTDSQNSEKSSQERASWTRYRLKAYWLMGKHHFKGQQTPHFKHQDQKEETQPYLCDKVLSLWMFHQVKLHEDILSKRKTERLCLWDNDKGITRKKCVWMEAQQIIEVWNRWGVNLAELKGNKSTIALGDLHTCHLSVIDGKCRQISKDMGDSNNTNYQLDLNNCSIHILFTCIENTDLEFTLAIK